MKCGVGKLSWVLMVAGLRAFHAGSNANLSEAQVATPPPEQVALRAHAHAMVACGNGLRLAVFLASTFSASAQHMRTTRARLELWGALAALHVCACERVCVYARRHAPTFSSSSSSLSLELSSPAFVFAFLASSFSAFFLAAASAKGPHRNMQGECLELGGR